MPDFNKIPFLRILIPFTIGVLFQLWINIQPGVWSYALLVIVLAVFIVLLFLKQVQSKIMQVICVDLFLFFIASIITFDSQIVNDKSYYGKLTKSDTVQFIALVNDIPIKKPKTTKLVLKIRAIKQDDGFRSAKGHVIAYVKLSNASELYKPGTFVVFNAVLNEIKEPANPHEFNFRQYFNDKGVYHTVFLDSNAIQVVANEQGYGLWHFGLALKANILKQLKTSGLNKNAIAICSALITGFDDEIDKSLIESFAHSGTLHVLSVSGLHVGLIFLILNMFFNLFDKHKRFNVFRFIFIAIVLWLFALITGFSPPVLRAVIMFNLLAIGNMLLRNKGENQLNILFASAFILLFLNPLLIRNVGFLLSYSALFGILFFYKKLSSLYTPKNKLMASIWQSAVLSVSATITTLPITLCVFHQFPIWFVFANLIIVPLIFVLLVMSFISLTKISIVCFITNGLTNMLVSLISIFNEPNYSFIDRIDFSYIDALFLSGVIFIGTLWIIYRNYNLAIFTFVILIAWQGVCLIEVLDKKLLNEIVIYHTPKKSNMSVKNATTLVLSPFDSVNYSMHIKPNVTAYNYPHITFSDFNYVKAKTTSYFILNQKDSLIADDKLAITHLIIANNAVPSEKFVKQHNFKVIMVDASNNYSTFRKMQELCSRMGIRYINIKNAGAFVSRI